MNGIPGKPRILIVDDTEANLIALRALLGDLEAEVFEARSGNEALAKILDGQWAVVFLDVQMPEMDGFEVARYIRMQKETQALPIIFLTAYQPEEFKIFEGYASGAVDFLIKPLTPEVVRAKAKVFLELDRQRRALDRSREIEKLNGELKERYNELEEMHEELRQYTYIASHDMREPVRRMLNLADLISLDVKEANYDELNSLVTDFRRSANETLRLVDSFRSLTSITELALKRAEVDLNEVVKEILQERSPEIARRSIQVDLQSLPKIEVNRSLIRQLFSRLIDNAIAHSQSKPIELRVSAHTRQSQQGAWIFEVFNSGSCIKQSELKAVLLPLKRITTENKETHIGIGLSVCKRIVEKHKGKIWLESGTDSVSVQFTLSDNQIQEVAHGQCG